MGILSGLRDAFDNRFESGRIRERRLAEIEGRSPCAACPGVQLVRFTPAWDNLLAEPAATRHGGGDWFCPSCRRLYECTDLAAGEVVDVTIEWVELAASGRYCSACTGFLTVDANAHPPAYRCARCDALIAADLDELRVSSRVAHLGLLPHTAAEYGALLDRERAALPPHPRR